MQSVSDFSFLNYHPLLFEWEKSNYLVYDIYPAISSIKLKILHPSFLYSLFHE